MHTDNPSPPSAPLPDAGDFVSTTEAARILGVARNTVCNWRWRKTGPRFYRVGSKVVRYRRSDLVAFVAGKSGKADAA